MPPRWGQDLSQNPRIICLVYPDATWMKMSTSDWRIAWRETQMHLTQKPRLHKPALRYAYLHVREEFLTDETSVLFWRINFSSQPCGCNSHHENSRCRFMLLIFTCASVWGFLGNVEIQSDKLFSGLFETCHCRNTGRRYFKDSFATWLMIISYRSMVLGHSEHCLIPQASYYRVFKSVEINGTIDRTTWSFRSFALSISTPASSTCSIREPWRTIQI